MFEDAFFQIGERIGALRVRTISALALAGLTPVILVAAGIYLWFNPTALCRQQTSTLFFGTRIGSDGRVEASDWARFVDDAILPRFPDGFTLLQGSGAWRSDSGATIREDSHLLIVARPSGAEIDGKLAAIADDYKTRFQQESVLRLDQCGAYRF